jgi:peptidoglycan/LPS O-acetylase OafA/YrhL
MPTTIDRPKTVLVLLCGAIDVALVIAFVLIGRASHNESAFGFFTTFWPFLVGLIVGWLISRFWLDPLRINWVAVIIVAITVVVGMVLRAVTGQGIEPGFVIVTTIVLGVFLIGWRLVAFWIMRGRIRAGTETR